LDATVNGETILVRGVAHRRCPRCDEILLWIGHLSLVQQKAVEQDRRKHGLLTGAEIREIRECLHLTRVQLTDLLRLGANTVSSWESAQSTSMDLLLRILRELPQARRYLKKHAA
jgi:putative zinc finger/helix-turn-helix YgiT family protein